MKRGKEALKELYKFEGFSFEDIFKEENRMIIKQKKKGKVYSNGKQIILKFGMEMLLSLWHVSQQQKERKKIIIFFVK